MHKFNICNFRTSGGICETLSPYPGDISIKFCHLFTGSTGMVGEGVLHECLLHPDIESVLVINRRPCGVSDPKLTEIIHEDISVRCIRDK